MHTGSPNWIAAIQDLLLSGASAALWLGGESHSARRKDRLIAHRAQEALWLPCESALVGMGVEITEYDINSLELTEPALWMILLCFSAQW